MIAEPLLRSLSETLAAPSPLVDERWERLVEAVDALRPHQLADGTLEGDPSLVAAVEDALARFVDHPALAHDAEYLRATLVDLDRWRSRGGIPDFSASLATFSPQRGRADGREHLVVLPMRLQNSGDASTRLEAVVTRTVWPRWLADVERRFANSQFVPSALIAASAGYDSPAATLFPETVAASTPTSGWGMIFCDREAERFGREVGAALSATGIDADASTSALLEARSLAVAAYATWDLLHDRTHMRGYLPFDPTMIRQRNPYWMYALEELRCDLTAYRDTAEIDDLGPYVRAAIVLDRVLRFPISGSRTRNYDGLAGQLLFSALHAGGAIEWLDGRLTIDPSAVDRVVAELLERIHGLYRDGVRTSRVRQWVRGHRLVGEYVPPTMESAWLDVVAPESDTVAWLDAVRPDEFPLSMFYLGLRNRLERDRTAVVTPG